ncbi:MAG: hypothetical protein Q8O67_25485 [Deltaproteobacteria bacterium]|nr:hypothetical protein [Deltaproteobacteria bacterium]
MVDADPKAARTALQALGISPGARLLPSDDLVLTLLPREDGLAPKDIPVDQLLHKITMMRDKLRVLEQRVNSSEVSTTEKAALQAHITAVSASFVGLVSFFSAEALPIVESTGVAPTTTATTTTTTTAAAAVPAVPAAPAAPVGPLPKTITRTPS